MENPFKNIKNIFDKIEDKEGSIEYRVNIIHKKIEEEFTKHFDANSYILSTKMLDMFNFEGNSTQNNQVFKTSKCIKVFWI